MEGQTRIRVCELCSGPPDLYCSSDDAFLCFRCDSTVHATNFLVARHVRLFICRNCTSLTGSSFSGPGSRSDSPACTSCTSSAADSISCSSSSAHSSTCISAPHSLCSGSSSIHRADHRRSEEAVELRRSGNKPINDAKIGAVVSNWCRKLGVNCDLVEAKAVQAMELCSGRLGRVLPFRLSLAASFWVGAKLSGDRSVATPRNLLKLALVSGVPAELIVRVELKLEEELRSSGRSRRRESEMEEGWGESGGV
ncbi:B-box zinc finger protein 32 [Linum perenne]